MITVMDTLLADPEHLRPSAGSGLRRIFGANPLSSSGQPWYQGAVGEIEMGKILARLDSGWTVLHAVPVGAAETDIDHVAIGATGVFTINTKHHDGKRVWVAGQTLMVSGQKQNHIRNSVHEATRASKLLSAAAGFPVPVEGVIAVVGAKSLTIKTAPAGTTVLTAPRILRWLAKRPPVLDDQQLALILTGAKQPGTWHRAPSDSSIPTEVQDGFRRVQKTVQAARRRRITWVFGGMLATAAASLAIFASRSAIFESLVIPMLAP